jgi:diacylglycerol kinase family enzyme
MAEPSEFHAMSAPQLETTAAAKIVVMINRKAGGETEEGFEATLVQLFREFGRDCIILHPEEGVDLRERLASANLTENAVVVAGGGDGTVGSIAAELAGTDKVLAVLPMGTLNHFAKDMGIPLDLRGAVRTAAQGRVSRIDVGEVNGRVFVNNSGLGIYPQIVSQREAEQQQRGIGKWPAFARATFSALRRYPFLKLRIRVGGEERLLKTACVFVGNNEYQMSGLKMGARTCINSGKLGFYVANRTGRLGLVRLGLRAIVGRLNQAKDFESFCIEEAWVESGKRTLLVATDGEVTRMKTPLHYRIRPGALQVLVPNDGEEAKAA